ncbi:uncharacterized protein A1O9_00377 [Exophiala aquamarina CBS 119918]|uniref:CAAX prenyl protease 2/Lysostaphin resistance protein A-like domain-containing protein n=1 Tax=Exophiala aquamarina CBS 119918 TaxID=1182545 RepID=A0A072Q3C9_9EURO|nr:uncharacterized protein A1O9_00377 [Exophiala aquamarina CBS 119918]KEF62405.1 hypothetical protein A1O9_00377 [Exophiala aquamarina CBS 119918]
MTTQCNRGGGKWQMAQSSSIYRHSTVTYFVSTFAISWGGILAVVGWEGFPGTQEQVSLLLPWVVLVMLAGPSLIGVLMIYLVYGKVGFQRLVSSLVPRGHSGVGWWAVAFLLAPLSIATVLTVLSLVDSMFRPVIFTSDDKASTLVLAFAYALAAGFFEELGWTAFAVRELRSRHSILATGLIVGGLWGAWHLIVAVWGSGMDDASGRFSVTAFLPQILFYVAVLPGYRILMVCIYERTASLGAVMVMHASLTASLPLALAPSATGIHLAISYFVLAIVLWAAIAFGISKGCFGSSMKEQKVACCGMLLCGFLSTVIYMVPVVVPVTGWKSYGRTWRTISELNALDSLTRALVGPLFVACSLLTIVFGIGIISTAGGNLPLRRAAIGLLGKEVVGTVVTLFSLMHLRAVKTSSTVTLHGPLTLVGFPFILLAVGAGASAFGITFRVYSLVTIALLSFGGCLAAMDTPKLAANISASWIGVSERVSVAAYPLWAAVLSVTLMRDMWRGYASELGSTSTMSKRDL